MSTKRIVGFVLLIVGIIAIIYAVHSMNRISSAKSEIQTLASPFSGSSGGRAVGGMLEGKASQYDSTVRMLFIGGIILVVVGGGVVLFSRKRKR